MLAQRVIADRHDVDALRPEGFEQYFESVRSLGEFSVGQSVIMHAREGHPCAHPHLSSDQLAMQDRPTSDRRPIYISDYRAPHREDGM